MTGSTRDNFLKAIPFGRVIRWALAQKTRKFEFRESMLSVSLDF